jgi:hypothetical protein
VVVVALGVDGPVDGALGDSFASPVRSCCVGGSAPGSEVLRHRVALSDDCAGLVDGDGYAVDVAQLVGLSGAPAGDDPGQQGCGDVTQRGVVVFAGVDHESLVFGGQGRVDPAGLPGGHE